MRATHFITSGLLGIALLVTGCESSGSSSGMASGGKTTVRGSNNERLTLKTPSRVNLERGDAETVKLHVNRQNFNEDVRVAISQLPDGVEAVDSPRYTSGDEIEVVLQARDDADLVQNHQAMVTADGPDGIRVSEPITINVRERS